MMKKIGLLMLLVSVWGCSKLPHMPEKPFFPEAPSVMFDPTEQTEPTALKTALLLPLSGEQSQFGEDLRNAAMLAQFERQGNQMTLLFFDTNVTAQGAEKALDAALDENPDLILGPVFAAQTEVVARENPDMPVISFTSDHSVLTEGVYSLALLLSDQVSRMTRFACESGKKKIAVLGPENKTGELVMNALSEAVQKCPDMTLEKVSLYSPQAVNLAPAVLKIVPKPIDPKKEDLTEEEKILLATPMNERVTFDALFIFEEGVRLRQLVSLLSYYDVTPEVVPFYGVSSWRRIKDKALTGAYFPALPTERMATFVAAYERAFGTKPADVAALAYDAVSLASFLSYYNALNEATLVSEKGYKGINGRFRLKENGSNERLLEVRRKTNRGSVLEEEAPQTFEVEPVLQSQQEGQAVEHQNPLLREEQAVTGEVNPAGL